MDNYTDSSYSTGVIFLGSMNGAITQDSGALLSGNALAAAAYGNVLLSEDNSTGIVAGGSETGEFVYHSTTEVLTKRIAGISGITSKALSRVTSNDLNKWLNKSNPLHVAPQNSGNAVSAWGVAR